MTQRMAVSSREANSRAKPVAALPGPGSRGTMTKEDMTTNILDDKLAQKLITLGVREHLIDTCADASRGIGAATAKARNVPAYVIFHDATLAAIAERNPASLDDLQGISGMGAKKLEAYGSEVLRVCAAAAQ